MITGHAQLFKKFPSFVYKTAAQLYIDYEFPRHLFIETTAACNLSCSYCPREKNKNHMDFGLFKSIIDESANYGPRSFSLHLFGEPLLYPQWREAIEYIKKKNKSNTVLFTSNGTLFERFIDDLTESGIDKCFWSWRPEPKWSESTIKKLKSWKAFTVRIIEEVTPKEIREEFSKWPRVEFRKLHNYGGNIHLSDTDSRLILKRWPCYHLWLAPGIAWNGNFLMCCSDPHQKEVFGNVREESIGKLWKLVSHVRQSHLEGKYSGICENCDVWKQYPDIFFSWQRIGSSSSGNL